MSDEYTYATYGDRIAEIYDERERVPTDEVAAASFLKEVAGGGPALELGIGTGRVALPLMEAGVEVHGIDTSEEMVERLRAKPGGDAVEMTMGSFADFSIDARFPLISAHPLRLRLGARPHGPPRGPAAPRALVRMGPLALPVSRRWPHLRVGASRRGDLIECRVVADALVYSPRWPC